MILVHRSGEGEPLLCRLPVSGRFRRFPLERESQVFAWKDDKRRGWEEGLTDESLVCSPDPCDLPDDRDAEKQARAEKKLFCWTAL